MDDKTLVTDFLRAKGETEFRALYRRHTPALYQSVWRLARGIEAEALELTQATWVRALERLASFRWESSFRTWLIGVAYNCYREHVRDNRREVSVDCTTIDEFPGKSPEPFTSAESIDLERALCRLPDGYREVLLLHDLEGYTHKEIGALLGIEEGTSKSQLSRARGAMRTALNESGCERP